MESEEYYWGDCQICGDPVVGNDNADMSLFEGDYILHKECMTSERFEDLQWIETFIKGLNKKMIKSELQLSRLSDLVEFFSWDNMEFQVCKAHPMQPKTPKR